MKSADSCLELSTVNKLGLHLYNCSLTSSKLLRSNPHSCSIRAWDKDLSEKFGKIDEANQFYKKTFFINDSLALDLIIHSLSRTQRELSLKPSMCKQCCPKSVNAQLPQLLLTPFLIIVVERGVTCSHYFSTKRIKWKYTIDYARKVPTLIHLKSCLSITMII